mmetsp:Transcript_24630/g.53982  ORF Transcript_24630/g.53982 Transcript_24630/m.53982 type:complete len:213 (+) Transcript_24630:241-879(+)
MNRIVSYRIESNRCPIGVHKLRWHGTVTVFGGRGNTIVAIFLPSRLCNDFRYTAIAVFMLVLATFAFVSKLHVADLEAGPPACPRFVGRIVAGKRFFPGFVLLLLLFWFVPGLDLFDALLQGIGDAIVAPDHRGVLVGCHSTHPQIMVQSFYGWVAKERKKVPEFYLWDDRSRPLKGLSHHSPRKADGRVQISEKNTLGPHVVLEVHFESRQ